MHCLTVLKLYLQTIRKFHELFINILKKTVKRRAILSASAPKFLGWGACGPSCEIDSNCCRRLAVNYVLLEHRTRFMTYNDLSQLAVPVGSNSKRTARFDNPAGTVALRRSQLPSKLRCSFPFFCCNGLFFVALSLKCLQTWVKSVSDFTFNLVITLQYADRVGYQGKNKLR